MTAPYTAHAPLPAAVRILATTMLCPKFSGVSNGQEKQTSASEFGCQIHFEMQYANIESQILCDISVSV